MITYKEAKRIIEEENGSVLINGNVVTSVKELNRKDFEDGGQPSDEEKLDEKEKSLNSLQKELEAKQKELDEKEKELDEKEKEIDKTVTSKMEALVKAGKYKKVEG